MSLGHDALADEIRKKVLGEFDARRQEEKAKGRTPEVDYSLCELPSSAVSGRKPSKLTSVFHTSEIDRTAQNLYKDMRIEALDSRVDGSSEQVLIEIYPDSFSVRGVSGETYVAEGTFR